jgi:hypothetical protein
MHLSTPNPPVGVDDNSDEATRMASVDSMAAMKQQARRGEVPRGGPKPPPAEERTRAVDIRNDKSISDIDWDLE